MNIDPKNRGLTLIELIVTVSLLAITITFAAPSFVAVIQNNRSINLTNDLIGSLNMARSEAIKRGSSVSVCAASNQNFNSCGNNWNQGWIVFVNPDENNTFANNTTEPIIRLQQIHTQSADISLSPAGVITYTSNGFAASNSANKIFSISSHNCVGNNARRISISPTGRAILTQTTCP